MNDEPILWKRGDIDPTTGRVYLCKQKSCANGLRFVTLEEFERRKQYGKQYSKSPVYVEKQKISRNTDEKRQMRNEYGKEFRKSDIQKKRAADYARKRRSEDAMFCITGRIRARINESLRKNGYTKRSKLTQILGCSDDVLRLHLESQFKEGMNWENRSMWEIDHAVPISSAKSEEDVIRLNHYTNLVPLWTLENRKKGNKMPMQEMDAKNSARDDWK